MEKTTDAAHHWRFCRLGGFDQVRLEREEDIRNLDRLDQKLWAALSCPVSGLEFDTRTMTLLDSDGDGQVRAQEVLAAVKWTSLVLARMDGFMAGSESLSLSAIDDRNEEGKHVLASARRLLDLLGKSDSESISIADVADTDALLLAARFNGDGIVPPQAATDADTRQLLEEIITCVGSDQDRSGKQGISSERVAAFFDLAEQYQQWWEESWTNSAILPFGDNTEAAAAVYHRLQAKIDDYFLRCGLASFDPGAAAPMNPATATYEALGVNNLTTATAELEQFPLARITAAQPLPLQAGINPAWADDILRFNFLVVEPVLGNIEALEREQWLQLKQQFVPYETWQNSKKGAEVESLGISRIQEIVAGNGREQLEQLIADDLAPAEEIADIGKVVRLVHYNRDLCTLLKNFVSFYDFYSQNNKAVFQAGTLYIDGRTCELCVRVQSAESHSAMAILSKTYLAYCACRRRTGVEKMVIAVAFTGGDSDNLMVGRNGVFYDRQGNDWDATIIKIIDHPISVSQAFWAPYKRVARMIAEQIEKFATAKDKAVDAQAGTGLSDLGAKVEKSGTPPPFDVAKFAGIFAAIGLAIGAIGTAVASIFGVFFSLPAWQMPLAIGGAILAISGPSMIMAFFKLRQRNLGPILDANGWAVNTRARLNIPFGSTLTRLAELPKGAERTLVDPFAEKKRPWKFVLFVLILLTSLGYCWQKGYLDKGLAMLRKPPATVQQPVSAPAAPPVPPAQ